MGIKRLLIILLLFVCALGVYAQWDAQISQYWQIKNYYNPAFAGETNNLQMTGLYRHQWTGIKNAPKTFIGTGDMPIKFMGMVHGVGANIMTESIGLYKNNSYGLQYAFKKNWKKWKNNYLNIGVQLGMMNISFDPSGIITPDEGGEDDPVIPTGDAKADFFDANLGVTWITPKYYAGFSVTHLTQPKYELGGSSSGTGSTSTETEESSAYVARTFYLIGGYNIQFRNPLYELQPSFLVKTDNVVMQYDVTLRMIYNKMFNGGVSWRKDDGFVFLLGFSYKGFDAGYAYDLSTSEISKVSGGSHEIFLRYSMPIKLDKGEKKGHKSIRIL